MTPQELKQKFNNEFGLKDWPSSYEVDYETYANVCQYIFWYKNKEESEPFISVALGKNSGIMFKGVELICNGFFPYD